MTYENSEYSENQPNLSSKSGFNQNFRGVDMGKKSPSYSEATVDILSSSTGHESDVTKAIRESMERNSSIQNSALDLNFKEVFDLAKIVINEIPVAINKTGRTINKIVDISKEGFNNINNFANNFKDPLKDKS